METLTKDGHADESDTLVERNKNNSESERSGEKSRRAITTKRRYFLTFFIHDNSVERTGSLQRQVLLFGEPGTEQLHYSRHTNTHPHSVDPESADVKIIS